MVDVSSFGVLVAVTLTLFVGVKVEKEMSVGMIVLVLRPPDDFGTFRELEWELELALELRGTENVLAGPDL